MPEPLRRPIPFTIDGETFTTDQLPGGHVTAADLLRLAGLDPANYDLGELQGKDRPEPKHYDDAEVVEITKDAIFVSVREQGTVA